VFARFCSGDRHLGMQVIGSGDIHHVDAQILDDLLPVRRPAGEAKLTGPLFQRLRLDVCDDLQDRSARFISKDKRNVLECSGVGLAHPARTDQPDVYRFHR